MSDMKCPFCQQELVIPKEEIRNGIQCCVCRNPKCEFDGWHFPVKLVKELIRTRKALETTQEFITKLYLNGNITDEQLKRYKKMLITALEQKD